MVSEKNITVGRALTGGDIWTKLSAVIMGAGLFGHGQRIKGILVFLLEISFMFFMAAAGLHNLAMLPSLGTVEAGEVYNEAKGIYEYTQGDNSLLILLYGVVAVFVVLAFILLWILQMKHSYKIQKMQEEGS